MLDLNLLEKKLFDYNRYDAWQFVRNTMDTIKIVAYCVEVIDEVEQQVEHIDLEWQQALKKQCKGRPIPLKVPEYNIFIGARKMDAGFLLNKIVRDFFQYARNAFDSMAQITNAGLLANRARAVDSTDCPQMHRVMDEKENRDYFPKMNLWYKEVVESDEYKYLDAVANRIKHTLAMDIDLQIDILGHDSKSYIGPFHRKGKQHDGKDTIDYVKHLAVFVKQKFESFLTVFEEESNKVGIIPFRYHSFYGEQQKTLDGSCDFAVLFIKSKKTFIEMPDEIFAMLLHRYDNGNVDGQNMEENTILVKDQETNEWIGRYYAEDSYVNDNMLRYRKYKKKVDDNGSIAFVKTIEEWKKRPRFFHTSPFLVELKTITDDPLFSSRIQVPF